MTRNRAGFAALGALALCGASGVVALGQGSTPVPVVSITASTSTATVSGADALTTGAAAFKISTPAHHTIAIARLKPGKTAADLKAAIKKSRMDATPVLKVADLVGGGGSANGSPYEFAVTLAAATYEVVDDSNVPVIRSEFKVTSGITAPALPAADATVTMKDFKILGSNTLPATGRIRVTNNGPSPHFLAFARLKHPSDARRVVALIRRKGGEQKAGKLIDQASGTGLVGLISAGTTDVVSTHRVKPGTYLLACFYADARSHHRSHTQLGMERVVTVR